MKHVLVLDGTVIGVYDAPVITPRHCQCVITEIEPKTGQLYVNGQFYDGNYGDFLNSRHAASKPVQLLRKEISDALEQLRPTPDI